jgi:hypothetical protein
LSTPPYVAGTIRDLVKMLSFGGDNLHWVLTYRYDTHYFIDFCGWMADRGDPEGYLKMMVGLGADDARWIRMDSDEAAMFNLSCPFETDAGTSEE